MTDKYPRPDQMGIVHSRQELRSALAAIRSRASQVPPSIGLVPTMGALHEGHLALIRRAAAENDLTVVSVFVNPAQFGDPADLARYPRDLTGDAALAREAGADVIFAPEVETIYPPHFATSVQVAGLTERWEGPARPGHFQGVTTVVTILLNLVQPTRAYFGEKDYQQLVVIRRLHADLSLPGSVVGCPTLRDADGLALSSRNTRLSPAARAHAGVIPRALFRMADLVAAGEVDARRIIAAGQQELSTATDLVVDYLNVVDSDSLEPLETVRAGARAIIAASLGDVRLIDNLVLASSRGMASTASPHQPERVVPRR